MSYISILTRRSIEIGKVHNFEGEVLDIKVNKINEYHAGDTVTCVYFGARFHTKILRKNESLISIYISITQKDVYYEQRKNPRILWSAPVQINDNMEENIYYTNPVKEGIVTDVSITGVGFCTTKRLSVSLIPYYLYLDLEGNTLRAEVIIKHEKFLENKFQYGSEIQHISRRDFELLLRFILINQIKQSFTEEVGEENEDQSTLGKLL